MQIQFGLANFAPEWSESVVCIGTFDGVHLGHRQVISRAVSIARDLGLPCCLATFDRHPAATLKPELCPPAILSLEQRLEGFREMGIALTVVLPFDLEFSRTEADDFLAEVLIDKFKARQVVVGHDFAMGKGRVGDAEWLRARVSTEIVPPFERFGERVSSSLIRQVVVSGNMETAEQLLGQAFKISGIVVSGDRLGRQLGYPTANIARTFRQITPPDGVYAGSLSFQQLRLDAAISIGTRPSVGGVDRRLEAYCLDYHGEEFYGETCVLSLYRLIRGQASFGSLQELTDRIAEDVAAIRTYNYSRSGRESVNA